MSIATDVSQLSLPKSSSLTSHKIIIIIIKRTKGMCKSIRDGPGWGLGPLGPIFLVIMHLIFVVEPPFQNLRALNGEIKQWWIV